MKCDLSIGDIFELQSVAPGIGYGQILRSDILQFIVIFEPVLVNNLSVNQIANSARLLSGWTMDAKFRSGDWRIIGNAPLPQSYLYPEYKVVISNKIWVTDL